MIVASWLATITVHLMAQILIFFTIQKLILLHHFLVFLNVGTDDGE